MGPTAEHLTDGFSLWKITFCPIVQFRITVCASCKAETVKTRDLLEKSERMAEKKSLSVLMEFCICLLLKRFVRKI